MTMRETWGLNRMLSWIAFRRDDFMFDNPEEIRRAMRRNRKLLVDRHPARSLLRSARSGEIGTKGRHGIDFHKTKMSPIDWMQISEAQVWEMAEFEWLDKQGKIRRHVEYQPNLRMKLVADDGREFHDMGPAFVEWSNEMPDLWSLLIKTNKLNSEQCQHFWTWLGRTDKPPCELATFFNAEDMHRIWPEQRSRP